MKKIILLTFIALVLLCVIPSMALETGSISVTSDPSGAQINIYRQEDGTVYTSDGITPQTFENVPVGTYSVEVILDGTRAGKGNIIVTSSQTTIVEFQLIQPTMDVSITSESGDPITGLIKRGEILLFNIGFHPLYGPYPFFQPLYFLHWEFYFFGEGLKYLEPQGWSTWHSYMGCLQSPDNPWECVDPAAGVTLTTKVKEDTPAGTKLLLDVVGRFIAVSEPGVTEGQEFREIDTPIQLSVAPVPEFPSPYLPITAIIGFLGAVLLIQRTREY